MTTPKLCINCRYYSTGGYDEGPRCDRIIAVEFNPIYGDREVKLEASLPAERTRSVTLFKRRTRCGPKAYFYRSKDP